MNAIENSYMVNREVGELGLSIATDLAISRILGKHPEIVDKYPPMNDYNHLLINLRTLVRNFYGAMDNSIRKQFNPKSPVDKILDEIAVIEELIGSAKVATYYCTYADLVRIVGEPQVRRLNTVNQIQNAKLEEDTTLYVLERLQEKGKRPGLFETYLKNPNNITKPLLLTHQPVDLLSAGSFTGLTLLESHTGAIKPRLFWNTKLGKHKGERPTNMPFNVFTLKVFGDNGNLVNAQDNKIREALMQIAIKYKWTPTTTMDRIRWGISNIADDTQKSTLMGLL